jgi:restriction system protein
VVHDPRQFEELIAALFRNHGFEVELTAQTQDGGYDIVAASHSRLSSEVALIEVKHFAPHRPVGVGLVRALYGVKHFQNADKVILVTSSYISDYAKKEFSRVIPWEMEFAERSKVLEWCRSYLTDILKVSANTTSSQR